MKYSDIIIYNLYLRLYERCHKNNENVMLRRLHRKLIITKF